MSYVVDLTDGDLMWLAWAAGVADGKGHTAAGEALTGILTRVQPFDPTVYDTPSSLGLDYDEEEQEWEDAEDYPTLNDPLPPQAAQPLPGESLTPMPGPINHPSNFGAGPPPGGMSAVNP